jgi:hypothetical protein
LNPLPSSCGQTPPILVQNALSPSLLTTNASRLGCLPSLWQPWLFSR